MCFVAEVTYYYPFPQAISLRPTVLLPGSVGRDGAVAVPDPIVYCSYPRSVRFTPDDAVWSPSGTHPGSYRPDLVR